MTDGIDEFRVLPENVNLYLEKGFMLMKYCKYCDSFYLPSKKKVKRVCCGKKECRYKYLKEYDNKHQNWFKKRIKSVRKCKVCDKVVGKKKQYCKSCYKKRLLKKVVAYNKIYMKTYTPPLNCRIATHLRSTIANRLKNNSKSASTEKLIGCTFEYFKEHLEKQFQPGMNWDNHTTDGWHIDHIIPVSHFDLSKPEEQMKAFHYSNCQPLWSKDNLSKGNRYVG